MACQTPGLHLPVTTQACPFSHANVDAAAREALGHNGHQEPWPVHTPGCKRTTLEPLAMLAKKLMQKEVKFPVRSVLPS